MYYPPPFSCFLFLLLFALLLFVLLASRLSDYFLSNHRCYFCSQLVRSPFPHDTWISLWGQQGFPSYGS